jgi:surfactin synthase thioesterase subunit
MARTPIQLFCFPYAGASAAIYRRWRAGLPAWIESHPVELPGHGRRFGEPLETSIAGIVAGVLPELRRHARGPFALFGHSLGALIAFEVAHALRAERAGEPLMVFASGTHAPSRWEREPDASIDTDAGLRAELARLDGTPGCVMSSPELMELTLPIVRADFQAGQRYRCAPTRRIGCAIHAIGGADDTTDEATLQAWGEHTTCEFARSVLPGGHFFIHEQEGALLRLIEHALTRRLATRGGAQRLGDRSATLSAGGMHAT